MVFGTLVASTASPKKVSSPVRQLARAYSNAVALAEAIRRAWVDLLVLRAVEQLIEVVIRTGDRRLRRRLRADGGALWALIRIPVRAAESLLCRRLSDSQP